jgi:hypothetical protein
MNKYRRLLEALSKAKMGNSPKKDNPFLFFALRGWLAIKALILKLSFSLMLCAAKLCR